jgi:AsmA protein
MVRNPMSRSLKLTLVATGALVGLLSLVAVAGRLLLNKSRLAAATSEVLGMDVDVAGRATIGFFPNLHVTLEDVHLRNQGVDFISAEQVDVRIAFLPLLARKVRFRRIALEHYRISIERDVDGKFNFEPKDGVLPALDLLNLSFSNGTLHYADQQSGSGVEATGCDLDVRHMSHPGGKLTDLSTRLSIAVDFVCAEMQKDDLVLSDLQGSFKGSDGIFDVEPVTMLVFGGKGSGSVEVDRSGPVPRLHARYSLLQFRIEEFLKVRSPERSAQGPMDLTMNLTMQGSTWHQLRQTAQGDVSLMGENLTLVGRDLDKELSRYESSQHFNLVDLGALFLAGPLGLAVTKGYDFASLLRGSGGSTRIRTLVSKWRVERGVAHAEDVALATSENLLALQGGLDLVDEEFDDVTVALVDPSGCPEVCQRIRGSFLDPVVERPNFLKSMAGPGIRLVKRARALFPGGKCEVFYRGSVPRPERPSTR